MGSPLPSPSDVVRTKDNRAMGSLVHLVVSPSGRNGWGMANSLIYLHIDLD